jgi:hypothetical protein
MSEFVLKLELLFLNTSQNTKSIKSWFKTVNNSNLIGRIGKSDFFRYPKTRLGG